MTATIYYTPHIFSAGGHCLIASNFNAIAHRDGQRYAERDYANGLCPDPTRWHMGNSMMQRHCFSIGYEYRYRELAQKEVG